MTVQIKLSGQTHSPKSLERISTRGISRFTLKHPQWSTFANLMAHNVENRNVKCPKNVNAQMRTSRETAVRYGLVETRINRRMVRVRSVRHVLARASTVIGGASLYRNQELTSVQLLYTLCTNYWFCTFFCYLCLINNGVAGSVVSNICLNVHVSVCMYVWVVCSYYWTSTYSHKACAHCLTTYIFSLHLQFSSWHVTIMY